MAVTVAMWVSADGAANPQARPARIIGKFEELYALTGLRYGVPRPAEWQTVS